MGEKEIKNMRRIEIRIDVKIANQRHQQGVHNVQVRLAPALASSVAYDGQRDCPELEH